jgi:hypothetical protein
MKHENQNTVFRGYVLKRKEVCTVRSMNWREEQNGYAIELTSPHGITFFETFKGVGLLRNTCIKDSTGILQEIDQHKIRRFISEHKIISNYFDDTNHQHLPPTLQSEHA